MSERKVAIGDLLVDLMHVSEVPCVKIDAGGLLRRDDMQKLIKSGEIATWGAHGGYQDAFFTYDNGEGSNADSLPPDVWDLVCDVMERRGEDYCLVWLAETDG